MQVETVTGDLLDQDVDVVVNPWNRNVFPWWLLLPRGVSRAIKRRAGLQPFRELARHGPIPLGGAILTSPGGLPLKGIIHVAGIDLLWRASEHSIRSSVRSAIRLYRDHGFRSIAFPIIGGGSWGIRTDKALAVILAELSEVDAQGRAVVVRYASD